MLVTYCDWGGAANPNLDQYSQAVREVHSACVENSSCEVIELRIDVENYRQSIIVEFGDGSFEADNLAGIHRVERLALSYRAEGDFHWEVRALRNDFPITIHQNHVPEGEPCSLCLYIEPWVSLERTWTPQSFLRRIFWWLRATADGTIHGDDQPIEHLFFSSPISVVLPESHFSSEENAKRAISFTRIAPEGVDNITLVGKYSGDDNNNSKILCVSVSVLLDQVENGALERFPYTLWQLQNLLTQRNSDVVEPLRLAIQELAVGDGIEIKNDESEFVLLSLGIPRSRNGNVEHIEIYGFIIDEKIGPLGEKLSVLCKIPGENRWYRDIFTKSEREDWKNIQINPVNVRCYPSSKEIRSYSGLNPDDGGRNGIIAGVGALGGLLGKIWKRECWGKWTYVDDDIIQAHNIVRHVSTYHGVGHPKSAIVSWINNNIHQQIERDRSNFLVANILSDNKELANSIKTADLLVDATTTLHVPREISRKDHYPRTASIFIAPSGMASVLLLEDENRNIRCNCLEAQYYRAILDSDWGERHLSGHYGRHWVGAGCREVTLSMSDELVHLHAATLARQLRKNTYLPEAKICIWDYQEETGGVVPHDISVFQSQSIKIDGWDIIWDKGFIENTRKYRADALPNETGGILFGIIDQKDRSIILVKACSAPENSQSTPSSFSRGSYDSSEVLDECHERTAGIVAYIGEWHSHPPGCGSLPSKDDIGQLDFLTSSLQIDGMPALMMIIGQGSVGFYINQDGKVLDLDNL